MLKKIYHGSGRIIRSPKFGAGSAYNDFGLGFYCTDNMTRACQWATKHGENGFVSKYLIDTSGLAVIDLGSPRYTLLSWISVLLGYREFDTFTPEAYRAKDYIRTVFGVDSQGSDCMIGWRADDISFMYVQDFLNGRISYEGLRQLLAEGRHERQFVLKSNRAFDRIVFDGYEAAMAEEVHPGAAAEEIRAMHRYMKMNGTGLYIDRILEENIQPYDPRLK